MKDKLDILIESEGFENLEDFLDEFAIESVVPGICKHSDCDYTTFVEPDQDRGWCEICEEQTVVSGLILAGII